MKIEKQYQMNTSATWRRRPRQGGFAMIELLGAFALALVAIGAFYVLYQMAFSTNRISSAINEINMTQSSINRLFSQQSTYAGLNNEIAVKATLVPSSMVVNDSGSATSITNAFGGFVTIAPDPGNGAAKPGVTTAVDSHYRITSTRIPKDACIQMATYKDVDWNGGVRVNGTYVAPENVVAATAACNASENTIIFVGR